MNILLLIDELPIEHSGMTLRIVEIFKKLSESHNIHFMYIGNMDLEYCRKSSLNGFCSSFNKIPLKGRQYFLGRILNILLFKHGAYAKYRFKDDYHRVRKELKNFVIKNSIDIMHVFGCFTAQYAEEFKNVVKIWDVADSYSLDIQRKLENAPFFKKIPFFLCKLRLFNYEKQIINDFSGTIFVCNIDAAVYKNVKSKHKIFVIPNGVNLDFFKNCIDLIEDYPSVVFSGHMSFLPNIEAVRHFVSKIYPLVKKVIPETRFYVVGADVTSEIKALHNRDGIIVTGQVDDMRPFLQKATIFVNPMISGCGIKNKLLQAMSMKKAIVSTRLGAESVSITDNTDIMIADNQKEFAEKVITLLRDDELRRRLGLNARRTVENNYSWSKALSSYRQLYEKLYNETSGER